MQVLWERVKELLEKKEELLEETREKTIEKTIANSTKCLTPSASYLK